MAISLQADSTLPQGYILVDGQRVATVSTTGLSAVLDSNTVTANSLISGAVTTEKIANNSVTNIKVASNAITTEKINTFNTLQVCKAWVNFRGNDTYENVTITNIAGGTTIAVTSGSSIGTWTQPTGYYHDPALNGMRFFIPTINSVAGTLGGVSVSGGLSSISTQCQFLSVQPGLPSVALFRMNAGPAQFSQSVNSATSTIVYRALGIRESYNISRIERASANAGDYRIYFETPMSNPFYLVAGTTNIGHANAALGLPFDTASWDRTLTFPYGEMPTVNSFRVRTGIYGQGNGENHVWTSIAVFGV